MIKAQEPEETDPEIELVSKSAMKRYAHELRDLGEQLLKLDDAELNRMPISDRLADAVRESRNIRSFGAKKRHLQYIGRLMLEEDEDAIEQQLALRDPGSALYRRIDREAEIWRERILTEPNALTEFIDQFPQSPIQPLRQAVRNAAKEQRKNQAEGKAKAGKQYTALLRLIREQITAAHA